MRQSYATALGIVVMTIIITALVIFLCLDVTTAFEVHQDIVNALVGFAATACVCCVAVLLRNGLARRFDRLEQGQDEIRAALSEFASGVVDYGDSRVTEDRLAGLRELAPRVNGNRPHPLRSTGR